MQPPLQQLCAPTAWRAVEFAADIHLHAQDAATAAAWTRYLQTTQADALFILGDLFELWVGDDIMQADAFTADCVQAIATAAQRMAVYFMPGNRDFLTGAHFLATTGMTALADPAVLEFMGNRYALSHGDALCLDDTAYMQFRAQVRSSAWQQQFLTRPLQQRLHFAQQARQTSAQHQSRTASQGDQADVNAQAALDCLRAAQASVLIHGHTHRPGEHRLSGHGHRRVVLSDWDACAAPPRLQVLRLDGNGLRRVNLPFGCAKEARQ